MNLKKAKRTTSAGPDEAPSDQTRSPAPKHRRRVLWGLGLFLAGLLLGGTAVFFWMRAEEEGLPPRRWEATVYLPLTDNAGKPFSEQDWDDAVGILVAESGGATLGFKREGIWVDERKHTRRESVRAVVVSFPRDRLANFRRALVEAGRRLGQEAVYVRLEEPRVEILTVPAKKEK
jgi:hypothetical protein